MKSLLYHRNLSKHILLRGLFIFLVSVAFAGCLSVKPAGVKSGKNLFETFFVGEEGTQYFIKPVAFKNSAGEELLMDVTFRYKNEIKDSATLNTSLHSTEIIRSIDSLAIDNSYHRISAKNIHLLFNEKGKKLFNSRFSMKFPLSDLNTIYAHQDWNITIYKQGKSSTYTSPESTKKSLKKVNDAIFILFR